MCSDVNKIIRVAHADDHLLLSMAMADNMRHYPQISLTIQAQTGKELIEAMHANPTLPDIVLLDIDMRDMNGFQTAAYIKIIGARLRSLHSLVMIQIATYST